MEVQLNLLDVEPEYMDLGATDSYHRRRALWFPKPAPDGRLGTVRIICQKGKNPGASDCVDNYGVQENTADPIPGCREFLLLNDTDPIEEGEVRDEVYKVLVTAHAEGCTCRAGLSRRNAGKCKHCAVVRKLIDEGKL